MGKVEDLKNNVVEVPTCRDCLPSKLHDPERLRVLREAGLVDSPAEGSLDRMTRFAQVLLDVPVALISLVDDHRQFFKSQQGLPEPWATQRQTPLTHSFCQHVVTSAEPLVIEDARLDERVKDNLAIPDLGVIAYAGYPIVAPDQQVLGSLCAIHGEPHQWSERELMVLRELADAVSNHIALRMEVLQHKRTTTALMEEKEKAEKANRAKSIFLGRVSHELRTPLNAIIGFSEIVHDEVFGSVNPKQKRYIGNVLSSARHLLNLINTLLDLSAIEEEELKLDIASNDMAVLVRKVCQELEALAVQKEQTLTCQDLPQTLEFEFDQTRIRQVITNLIGNAMKFTQEGGSIAVTLEQEDNFVSVRVTDNGSGLSQEEQQRVFDPFYRTDDARNVTGAGLGLPISKGIVELHGGTLVVKSSPEKGSTFSFVLPTKGERQ